MTNQKIYTPLIPLFLGLAIFCLVVGLGPLNPQNLTWIFGRFDPPQHYLGWVFFRDSPWTFPAGISPNYGMEVSSSIVYTDSIPLMAIIFKLVSPILPSTFQYLGIWLLICFILQAWFSWKILDLFTCDRWLLVLGAGLIAFAPPMLWRLHTPSGTQAALAAHFLILAALFLVLRDSQRRAVFWWICLLSASVLIHFYLFFIVGTIWFADLLDRYLSQKLISLQSCLKEAILAIIIVCLFAWQAGYFAISSSSSGDWGYGFFKLNLLSPVDPNGWSHVLPTIDIPTTWGEGFNYLGAGVILLLVVALSLLTGSAIGSKKKTLSMGFKSGISRHRFVLFFLAILFLVAITNNVGFGAWQIKFNLPWFLHSPLNILRSSSRMYWPIHYCLTIFAVYVICKLCRNWVAIMILGVAVLVQVVDTNKGWLEIREGLNQDILHENYLPDLKHPFWGSAANHYKKIVRIPVMSLGNKWVQFAKLAADHGMETNSVYFARIDSDKVRSSNKNLEEVIKNGAYAPDVLYVFEERFLIPVIATMHPDDVVAKVDDFYVLAPAWRSCKECVQIPSELILGDSLLVSPKNAKFGFSSQIKDSDAVFYLREGWSWREDWGVWSDGSSATINLPWPKIKPKSITLNFNVFLVAPNHPNQKIDLWINGVFYRQLVVDRFENNAITIPLADSMFRNKFLDLTFNMQNSGSPTDLMANNGDKRKLGVGLVSARFQ